MSVTIPHPILLLTRPRAEAEALARDWGARWDVDVVVSPLLDIVPAGALPDTGAYDGVIFTSAHGVRAYETQGGRVQGTAYTVGRKTDAAARALGFATRCADGNADALVALIRKEASGERLLHVHGVHTRGDIAARLTAQGIPADGVAVYDQVEQPLSPAALTALGGSRPVIVPLFSPRTARLFAIANNRGAPLYISCISAAVARAVAGVEARKCLIARHPDLPALQETVEDLIQSAKAIEGRSGSK